MLVLLPVSAVAAGTGRTLAALEVALDAGSSAPVVGEWHLVSGTGFVGLVAHHSCYCCCCYSS